MQILISIINAGSKHIVVSEFVIRKSTHIRRISNSVIHQQSCPNYVQIIRSFNQAPSNFTLKAGVDNSADHRLNHQSLIELLPDSQ